MLRIRGRSSRRPARPPPPAPAQCTRAPSPSRRQPRQPPCSWARRRGRGVGGRGACDKGRPPGGACYHDHRGGGRPDCGAPGAAGGGGGGGTRVRAARPGLLRTRRGRRGPGRTRLARRTRRAPSAGTPLGAVRLGRVAGAAGGAAPLLRAAAVRGLRGRRSSAAARGARCPFAHLGAPRRRRGWRWGGAGRTTSCGCGGSWPASWGSSSCRTRLCRQLLSEFISPPGCGHSRAVTGRDKLLRPPAGAPGL